MLNGVNYFILFTVNRQSLVFNIYFSIQGKLAKIKVV